MRSELQAAAVRAFEESRELAEKAFAAAKATPNRENIDHAIATRRASLEFGALAKELLYEPAPRQRMSEAAWRDILELTVSDVTRPQIHYACEMRMGEISRTPLGLDQMHAGLDMLQRVLDAKNDALAWLDGER